MEQSEEKTATRRRLIRSALGLSAVGIGLLVGAETLLGRAPPVPDRPAPRQSISVRVLYDGMPAADTDGVPEEGVVLASPAALQDLLEVVVTRHPVLAPMLPFMTEAINGETATPSTPLADGDEVYVVAPYAGG